MWIIVTLIAAGFQTARTALQHRLRALLSVSGAGFVRYVYGAPLAGCSGAGGVGGRGALAQIDAASGPPSSVAASPRSSARVPHPGIRCARLRRRHGVRQDRSGAGGAVLAGAARRTAAVGRLGGRGSVHGGRRAAGHEGACPHVGRPCGSRPRCTASQRVGCSGWRSIGIRGATKALDGGPIVMHALVTLAVMNTMQTVVHGGYLHVREPAQLRLAAGALAVERGGGCAQRVRLGGLGAGAGVGERGQGAHARSGGVAVHLRRRRAGGCTTVTPGPNLRPARWSRSGVLTVVLAG
jgi:hypothetical protein